ncbi:hypothetical protein MsAg5_08360 [Methanosarcinaceae archaeon Ag5]|uniref:Lipoprotein n=1 Tax=Methanolapillus africanus TaxID=3028297 RepID=A0AAE4MJU8_9EURY|nr:hypothetical protein [Methanosarcinaceae archaeon Ag5]
MKLKILSLGIVLLISVLVAGCLNSSPDYTSMNICNTSESVCNISEINSGRTFEDYYSGPPIAVDCTGIKTVRFISDYDQIPKDNLTVRAFKQNSISVNTDYIFYEPVYVTERSDLIVYGTVKEVRSFWTTPDGTQPDLGELQTSEWTDYFTNETHREEYYDSGRYEIYTYVYFTVDECVKGDCPEEINLYLPGGQVGNIVMYGSDFPKYWDFKQGDQCLLYLEEYSDDYELFIPSGIRTVVP